MPHKVGEVLGAVSTCPRLSAAAISLAVSLARHIVGLAVRLHLAVCAEAIAPVRALSRAAFHAGGVALRPLVGGETAPSGIAPQATASLMAHGAQPVRPVADRGCSAVHAGRRYARPRRGWALESRLPLSSNTAAVNLPTVHAQAQRLMPPLGHVASQARRELPRPLTRHRPAGVTGMKRPMLLAAPQLKVRKPVVEFVSVPVVDVVLRGDGSVGVLPHLPVLRHGPSINGNPPVSLLSDAAVPRRRTLQHQRVTVLLEPPPVGITQVGVLHPRALNLGLSQPPASLNSARCHFGQVYHNRSVKPSAFV